MALTVLTAMPSQDYKACPETTTMYKVFPRIYSTLLMMKDFLIPFLIQINHISHTLSCTCSHIALAVRKVSQKSLDCP